MYVIMDLEWFETEKHLIFPTQIAALRVDDDWNTLSIFNELICPRKDIHIPWKHVAFSGADSEAFLHARSAYTVFNNLFEWLQSDDILCWWEESSSKTLNKLIRILLKQNSPHATCILDSYFSTYVDDGKPVNGNPYSLAQMRGISAPKTAHHSINDVVTIQRLMRSLNIPTKSLQRQLSAQNKSPKITSSTSLFLYDASTNLLHVPKSSCVDNLNHLKGMSTIKSCIAKKYKPCPTCCLDTWKSALIAYNTENIHRRKCGYFFLNDSKVFHRSTCHTLLMTTKNYSASVYYDTCVNSGRIPCKICKPVPGLFTVKHTKEETGQWMKKHERRALNRYIQAMNERATADQKNMSAEEYKDMMTLTSSNFTFWAAHGYNNFHLRACRKLNGLTNLKGFETFQKAVRAGYSPCRECKPSPKHDLRISMPIRTKEKNEENLKEVLATCSRLGLKHIYKEPILNIYTDAAEWEINYTMKPVVIYHKPLGDSTFHQQHKMFMSVSDAIAYIAKHDRVRKPVQDLP